VLDLSDAEAARVRNELERRGFGVSAIASPIGKIGIDEPFEPHLARFHRALDLAELFGAPFIRLFSFYVPPGEAPRYREQVMARLTALAEAAEGRNVTIGHENERGIYGDLPERCLDIIRTINRPQWRTIFDPANYVLDGVRPFTDAYPLLADSIAYLHIKDARRSDYTVCPAGEGDGEVRQVLAALKERGFDGFLSLEPHLSMAGRSGGQTQPDLFRLAIKALRTILQEIGAA
ncbi:MAG: sugar phosphate isomerase/epimerase family protein, partial [Anaerolineae bacterium]|nr:sugar phosphate isomerase/epimerase family protein [Anaerolineae bacterium]